MSAFTNTRSMTVANRRTGMADEGEAEHHPWTTPPRQSGSAHSESPTSSPVFAPVGRPMVKKRFRGQRPESLRLETPRSGRISSLHSKYSVRFKPIVSLLNSRLTVCSCRKRWLQRSTAQTTPNFSSNFGILLLPPNFSAVTPSLASSTFQASRARRCMVRIQSAILRRQGSS